MPTSSNNACATVRTTTSKRPVVFPRRLLLTSMSQAFIALSLAVSIMTFVISLIEFLPMRDGDLARQESLQYNTFICLIVPMILAYCSQSRIISALTQKWILRRVCSLQECLSPTKTTTMLGDVFRHTASMAGLSCLSGPMSFFVDAAAPSISMRNGKQSSCGAASFIDSSKVITTNLTIGSTAD